MAFTKLLVAAVAALSCALPVVSAPIPKFEAATYEFFHARSHHVAIAEHQRDVVARSSDNGASFPSASSNLRRDDDDNGDDGSCSDDDSGDDDDDASPDGSETSDDDSGASGSADVDGGNNDDSSSSSDTTSTTSAAPAPSPNVSDNNNGSSSSGEQTNTGTATFFYQNGNAGACGNVNPDSALIGAMNTAQFEDGAVCGKSVQITNTQNGEVVTIQIADECPTCPVGNIDLSIGAFQACDSNLDDGVFQMEWFFTD